MQQPYPPLVLPPRGSRPIWWPINPMQQAARRSQAELCLIGGQSGGGKTSLLAADAMEEYRNPWLRALVLRLSLVEMQEMSDQMQKMYEPLGAKWKRPNKFSRPAWIFPSGAIITPGYLRHRKDLSKYRGNPFSCLELDESGEHPEDLIREMLAWLAAPVPGVKLRVRARFGSNPGGPGHGWQSAIFLRKKCPVHYPADFDDKRPFETSVYPGRVYQGARWPSDDWPVQKTTAFFPARLSDNPFYDKVKRDSLMTQTATIRAKLLDGCWCDAEGLYFPFLRPEHMVPFQKVPVEWWWGHFISIDYGYGNSSAAATMFAVSPSGQVFQVAERIEKKMGSVEFAERLCQRGFEATESPIQRKSAPWLAKLRPSDPEGPRMLFALFDQANDQHTGTGRSNFQLMSDVFARHGVDCMLAAHDPMGNAQNLYNGLANKSLVVTTSCPYTFGSLTSRTIDERKAVKKEKGNPQDDIYDSVAYGWNTWLGESVQPRRVALQERMEQMRRDGVDETGMARFRWSEEQKIRDEEAREGRGISLTGPRVGRKIQKR